MTPKAVFTPQANGFVYAAFQGNPRSFAGETRAQGFDVLHISRPGPEGIFTAVVRPMAGMHGQPTSPATAVSSDAQPTKPTVHYSKDPGTRGGNAGTRQAYSPPPQPPPAPRQPGDSPPVAPEVLYHTTPKNAAERQAENDALRKRLPKRKDPMSKVFESKDSDVHSLVRQKAVLLLEMLLEDGQLTHCPMETMTKDEVAEQIRRGKMQHGYYASKPDGLGDVPRIRTHRETRYPLLTAIHEMGHHIYELLIERKDQLQPLEQALWNACYRSRCGKAIQKLSSKAQKKEKADWDYWLTGPEIFCRALAQWVAARSEDVEIKQELQAYLRQPFNRYFQWPEKEFAPIMKRMESVLRAINYLK